MGQRISRSERSTRESQKADIFDQAKAAVSTEQRAVVTPFDNFMCQSKATQLDRKGMPFTKADLVAIYLKLQNQDPSVALLSSIQTMSCDDLRAHIRLLVYAEDFVKSTTALVHQQNFRLSLE